MSQSGQTKFDKYVTEFEEGDDLQWNRHLHELGAATEHEQNKTTSRHIATADIYTNKLIKDKLSVICCVLSISPLEVGCLAD